MSLAAAVAHSAPSLPLQWHWRLKALGVIRYKPAVPHVTEGGDIFRRFVLSIIFGLGHCGTHSTRRASVA
jgi:hypothetical protein